MITRVRVAREGERLAVGAQHKKVLTPHTPNHTKPNHHSLPTLLLVNFYPMSTEKDVQDVNEALNAAMEAALDEFDDDEEEEHPPRPEKQPASTDTTTTTTTTNLTPMTGPSPPPSSPNEVDALMEQMMQELLQGGNQTDPNTPPEVAMMGQFLQHMQTQLAQEFENSTQTPAKQSPEASSTTTSTNKASSTDATDATDAPETNNNNNNNNKSPLDETIASLVDSMAKHQLSPNDEDSEHVDDPTADAFLEQLLSGGAGPDALLQGMMQELMAQEIMAEPIQQVAQAFPAWLQQHKADLTPEEFQRCVATYHCRVLRV